MTRKGSVVATPAWGLAVGGMLSVQLGSCCPLTSSLLSDRPVMDDPLPDGSRCVPGYWLLELDDDTLVRGEPDGYQSAGLVDWLASSRSR